MNSAISYYSSAQMQADALRDARRNPIAKAPDRERRERHAPAYGSRLRAVVAWRAPLRPLFSRL